MALPDFHTGMPIIKIENEVEGIYASAALSDTRCEETDQGLTLPPEIQSSNVWRFDPAHAITDEEFEVIYGPLNPEVRRSSSPVDQSWLESLFRDDLESPEPPRKGRKASYPPRASRASSLRVNMTVLPAVSDIGQATVASIMPAHSPNDSGYGTSIAELSTDGHMSCEPQIIQEIPQHEDHDVLASIHSLKANVASNIAGQPTIDRSIADDMFGGDFDSDPRDEEALYYQNDQYGHLGTRGRGDDAAAARESPSQQVMPTDPDLPIPSIETQDEEELQRPLSITSIPSKSRPNKPSKVPSWLRKDTPAVKRPKLPSSLGNGQLQDGRVLPISRVPLGTTNGESSTHKNSLASTATQISTSQYEVAQAFASQYQPLEVSQSSTFPDSQLASPAAQQHQDHSQFTNLNSSMRHQPSHTPSSKLLHASPASITFADHEPYKLLLPSMGNLISKVVSLLPTPDTQNLLDPRVIQTVDTLIQCFKDDANVRTSIASALVQHVKEYLAQEVIGNAAHPDLIFDEHSAEKLIVVAHLLVNGGIITDPETFQRRSNAPDVGQAHSVDVNATINSEFKARFTSISELVHEIRGNDLFGDNGDLYDQLEKSITDLTEEYLALIVVKPQAQNHGLGLGGNDLEETYVASNSTITLPNPVLEIKRLEEIRQIRATQQTSPNLFPPISQHEQYRGPSYIPAYSSLYASSYDAELLRLKKENNELRAMCGHLQLNQSARPSSAAPISDSPESQSSPTFSDDRREYSEGPDGMIGWFCGMTYMVRNVHHQCLTFNHYKSKPKDSQAPAPIRKKCQGCKSTIPEDKKFVVNRDSFRNGQAVINQQVVVVNQIQPQFTPSAVPEPASRKRKSPERPESSDASGASKKKKSSGGFNISTATENVVRSALGKDVLRPWMPVPMPVKKVPMVDLTGGEGDEREGERGLSAEELAELELERELERELEKPAAGDIEK